jgi:hypothetical protein
LSAVCRADRRAAGKAFLDELETITIDDICRRAWV